jgi:cyclic pyranopterin phosphate synthase
LIRGGANDDELANVIASVWRVRTDRYSELRAALPPARKVEMSHIGG